MLSLLLSLLGMIAIVVFAIQVYKTAVDMKRNAVLWTLFTMGVGIVFQFILPVMIGVMIGVYYLMSGTPPDKIELSAFGLGFVLEIGCIVLSIVGMLLITKHVSNVLEDLPASMGNSSTDMPPPPPSFGG